MRKHDNRKKLSLSSETVRSLAEPALAGVAGGYYPTRAPVCIATVWLCITVAPCPMVSQDQDCPSTPC